MPSGLPVNASLAADVRADGELDEVPGGDMAGESSGDVSHLDSPRGRFGLTEHGDETVAPLPRAADPRAK